jgi:hypothetical protein
MGVVKGGVRYGMPIGVNCMVNTCLVIEWAFPGDVLWCAEMGATRACECFGWVHRAEALGVRPCEGVVDCKLECSGRGSMGVEWAFCFLASCIFLHINCC